MVEINIAGLVLALLIFAPIAFSMLWAANDASRRGKSPMLVSLLVLLLQPWPAGLVLWLLIRPKTARA